MLAFAAVSNLLSARQRVWSPETCPRDSNLVVQQPRRRQSATTNDPSGKGI